MVIGGCRGKLKYDFGSVPLSPLIGDTDKDTVQHPSQRPSTQHRSTVPSPSLCVSCLNVARHAGTVKYRVFIPSFVQIIPNQSF